MLCASSVRLCGCLEGVVGGKTRGGGVEWGGKLKKGWGWGSGAVSLVHCRQLNHKKKCVFMRLAFCSAASNKWGRGSTPLNHTQKKMIETLYEFTDSYILLAIIWISKMVLSNYFIPFFLIFYISNKNPS